MNKYTANIKLNENWKTKMLLIFCALKRISYDFEGRWMRRIIAIAKSNFKICSQICMLNKGRDKLYVCNQILGELSGFFFTYLFDFDFASYWIKRCSLLNWGCTRLSFVYSPLFNNNCPYNSYRICNRIHELKKKRANDSNTIKTTQKTFSINFKS